METLQNTHQYFKTDELNKIDKEIRFTVFGYVRNVQQLLTKQISKSIPKHVTLIIIAFYVDLYDEFNPNLCGKGMIISNDNKTVHNETEDNATVYGTNIIDSMITNKTYEWKLTIKGDVNHVYIGIANANAKKLNDNFGTNQEKAFYEYSPYWGTIHNWNERGLIDVRGCYGGDIITLILSFDSFKGIFKGVINDKETFIFSDNITREPGLKYRLAVSICTQDISITLLD